MKQCCYYSAKAERAGHFCQPLRVSAKLRLYLHVVRLLRILCQRARNVRIFAEKSERRIACIAEDSSNPTSVMAMVDCEAFQARVTSAADRTSLALRSKHLVIIVLCDAVLPKPSAHFVVLTVARRFAAAVVADCGSRPADHLRYRGPAPVARPASTDLPRPNAHVLAIDSTRYAPLVSRPCPWCWYADFASKAFRIRTPRPWLVVAPGLFATQESSVRNLTVDRTCLIDQAAGDE